MQLKQAYLKLLKRPGWLLVGVLGALLVAAGFASRFTFDASADTLVVEGDPDLLLYREISDTFGDDAFLLVSFEPLEGAVLSPGNLDTLDRLQRRLSEIKGVSSVFSVLDAPLLRSPPVAIEELADGYRTLRSADVDLALAAAELTGSPLFRELLISADGRTVALRVEIAPASPPERGDTAERRRQIAERAALIDEVRQVREQFSTDGTLHLGGVPMIAADMIDFVKRDLAVLGVVVLALLVAVLYAVFGQMRWVILPLGTAAASVLATMGVLGFMHKPATIISSNFVALLAIMTISLNIHLIVRYRELLQQSAALGTREIVAATMVSKFSPCLYTALTTMVAFGSLTVSRIVPVEDFGWMICIGVILAFLLTFSLFPAVLMLLSRGRPRVESQLEEGLLRGLGDLSRRQPAQVGLAAVAVAILTGFGIAELNLNNRFIDYFKDDTDISQGMVYIDQHLGGTVPFDVILNFDAWRLLEEDLFADETDSDPYPQRYWFTRDKLDRIRQVHELLEARPEVGKVVSLASLDALATELNGGEPLSDVQLAVVFGALPADFQDEVVRPYASPTTGQARLWARVIESGPYFDRTVLVQEIKRGIAEQAGLEGDEVAVAGMVVLFDAMIQKLVASQVTTLGYVLLATFIMFLVLLRSPLFALLGLAPNVLAAAVVLGFMGFAGISLDMMTSTIAAVSIGIGVDFAIHYLHRYRAEGERTDGAGLAISRTQAGVGPALLLTGLIIAVGFSVLCFSNFVPTILFGLLVALAMLLALLANLTLLPSLLALVERRDAGPKADAAKKQVS